MKNKKFKKNKIYIILILSVLSILSFIFIYRFKNIYNDDKISIIINFNSLTEEKHRFFNEVLKVFNTTRKYYFIKTVGTPLNPNLTEIVSNKTVKIIQSNFPDSIFLPLIVSLYGTTNPEYVIFIEGEDIINKNPAELIKWIDNAYTIIKSSNYDYIFGNSQIINGNKIGCSLLFSKSDTIQHLLFYTNSDTTHINPLIQFSLATETNFHFIPYKYTKASILEKTEGKFSLNMKCPSTNDNYHPSLAIMLPTFKRNYFTLSMPSYSKQTYQPKFYVIIQNDKLVQYNLPLIQNLAKQPVYHIWMQNWNSFFYLNHRFASMFPCDFVLKYDDDEWPGEINLQQTIMNKVINRNIIQGYRSYTIGYSLCGLTPKKRRGKNPNMADHVATPLCVRPGYFKLDGRENTFRLYGSEDVSLSVNSKKHCKVDSMIMWMSLIERQADGNSQSRDKQIVSSIKSENNTKFNIFLDTYCFLIYSGFTPLRWGDNPIPQNLIYNTTKKHKRLY